MSITLVIKYIQNVYYITLHSINTVYLKKLLRRPHNRLKTIWEGTPITKFEDVKQIMEDEKAEKIQKSNFFCTSYTNMNGPDSYYAKRCLLWMKGGNEHDIIKAYIQKLVDNAEKNSGCLGSLLYNNFKMIDKKSYKHVIVKFLFESLTNAHISNDLCNDIVFYQTWANRMILVPRCIRILLPIHYKLLRIQKKVCEFIDDNYLEYSENIFDAIWFNSTNIYVYSIRVWKEFVKLDSKTQDNYLNTKDSRAINGFIKEIFRLKPMIAGINYENNKTSKKYVGILPIANVDPKRYKCPMNIDVNREHSDLLTFALCSKSRKCPASELVVKTIRELIKHYKFVNDDKNKQAENSLVLQVEKRIASVFKRMIKSISQLPFFKSALDYFLYEIIVKGAKTNSNNASRKKRTFIEDFYSFVFRPEHAHQELVNKNGVVSLNSAIQLNVLNQTFSTRITTDFFKDEAHLGNVLSKFNATTPFAKGISLSLSPENVGKWFSTYQGAMNVRLNSRGELYVDHTGFKEYEKKHFSYHSLEVSAKFKLEKNKLLIDHIILEGDKVHPSDDNWEYAARVLLCADYIKGTAQEHLKVCHMDFQDIFVAVLKSCNEKHPNSKLGEFFDKTCCSNGAYTPTNEYATLLDGFVRGFSNLSVEGVTRCVNDITLDFQEYHFPTLLKRRHLIPNTLDNYNYKEISKHIHWSPALLGMLVWWKHLLMFTEELVNNGLKDVPYLKRLKCELHSHGLNYPEMNLSSFLAVVLFMPIIHENYANKFVWTLLNPKFIPSCVRTHTPNNWLNYINTEIELFYKLLSTISTMYSPFPKYSDIINDSSVFFSSKLKPYIEKISKEMNEMNEINKDAKDIYNPQNIEYAVYT